jgi:hypothetical protein
MVAKQAASPWNGGRKVAIEQGGWNTVAPSAVAYHENEEAPLALDKLAFKSNYRFVGT